MKIFDKKWKSYEEKMLSIEELEVSLQKKLLKEEYIK